VLIETVRRARIVGRSSLVDIRIDGGRITEVSPCTPGPGLDVAGRVVVPGFVDAHVHLDKAFHLDAITARGVTIAGVSDAIGVTSVLQRDQEPGENRANAEALLARMVRHGTTAARVHVEVNPEHGAEPVRWHTALARRWFDRIELQLVAFPQQGLLHEPGLLAALEEAMRLGCTVVGACPYSDEDQVAHVRAVFDLAARYEAPVDLHLDFSDDPSMHVVDDVVAETEARGWQGRVVVGHVTSLAAMTVDAVDRRAASLAAARIGVVALPVTDVFLGGRSTGHRALAPLAHLRAKGVVVAIATNNTQNAFTPFGTGSLLQTAWLAGVIGHAAPGSDHVALLEMITRAPAAVMGLDRVGTDPGCRADLVVLDTERPSEVVAAPAAVAVTVRRGRVSYCSAELADSLGEGG
jgi:cytosine deaminase